MHKPLVLQGFSECFDVIFLEALEKQHSPPEKAQRNFGSSHTARPANTARRPREPRPQPAMSLPVNVHHPVVKLTRKFYGKQGGGQRDFYVIFEV